MHDLLGETLRERCARRELPGELEGLREQSLLRDDAVDEPDPIRMFSVEEIAREHHLHRVAQAHDLLEPYETSVAGVETPLHVL